MTDYIHKHLQVVEDLQLGLEDRIREALSELEAGEILDRAEEIPTELADEMRLWIEVHLLPHVVEESRRFLQDIDPDEAETKPDEGKIHDRITLLLDSYIQSITILAQAAFGEMLTNAELQTDLGRANETVAADLANNKGALGAVFTGFQNALISRTDAFVSAAAGAAVTGSSEGELTWVVVMDGRECSDCAGRHGDTDTYDGWAAEGLPGSGWSVCRDRCRCILVPSGAFEQNTSEPVVRSRR